MPKCKACGKELECSVLYFCTGCRILDDEINEVPLKALTYFAKMIEGLIKENEE